MSRERRLGRGLEALLGKPLDGGPEYNDGGYSEEIVIDPPQPQAAEPDPGNGALPLAGQARHRRTARMAEDHRHPQGRH